MDRVSRFNTRFEFVSLNESNGKFVIEISNEINGNGAIVSFIACDVKNDDIILISQLDLWKAVSFIKTHLYYPIIDNSERHNLPVAMNSYRGSAVSILYKHGEDVTFWLNSVYYHYVIDFDYTAYIKNMNEILKYIGTLLGVENII